MDFHREIIGVLVIWVILVVSFGELVSLSFGESVSGNGRRLQIQSERGSALVLPLVELKRNGGDLDRRFKERRRRLAYGAESEEARMTLHDDLLTKGCDFSFPFHEIRGSGYVAVADMLIIRVYTF